MTFLRLANIGAGPAGIRRPSGILQNTAGNAAIEFALVIPIFALVFVASVDLGMVIFSRFQLEAAVSSGASYAIAHADQVDSTSGNDLAKNIALMIATNYRGDATASITINNGSQASYDGTTIKIGGAPSRADACYCPTGVASTLTWGSLQTCGSSCADGGRAGRFVSVSAQRAYTPFFSLFDIVEDGSLTASAIVQTK